MKRIILLILVAAAVVSFQLFMNCAQPLESDDCPKPDPPIIIHDTVFQTDTIYIGDSTYIVDTIIIIDTVSTIDTFYIFDTVDVVDTIITIDTIIYVDTFYNTDTINIYDTITIVDTVIIEIPDTSGALMYCARMSSHLKEIVWMFRNPSGDYKLEFTAQSLQNKPIRDIIVEIDGEEFEWQPDIVSELIFDLHLEEHSTVTIYSTNPRVLGHEIDICLTITPK